MKSPRDLGGRELGRLLRRFGYELIRQEGSHMRFTSKWMGPPHHITIPDHNPLRIGTQNRILADIATYLRLERSELMRQLFGN